MTDRTQAKTATHTPTPWKLSMGSTHITGVCKFESIHGMYPNYEANAALIVDAVNSHASLKARIAELEANEKAYEKIIGKKTFQEVADRIRELEEALRFYADEWRLNGDGESETPGLSRSWMEPTDALFNDEGRKARDLVDPKDPTP